MELLKNAPVVVPDRNEIYISLYKDGIYRQRCGLHIEESIAPLFSIWRKQKVSAKHGCVMCAVERRRGGEGNVMVDEVVE